MNGKIKYGAYANQKNSQPDGELSKEAEKAIFTVLEEQAKKGGAPHWDSSAHRAAIALLAKAFGMPEEKRKAFRDALKSEPFDYASNMKKRLESAGLVKAGEKHSEDYA